MRPDILLLLLLASGAFWMTLQAVFGWQVVVIVAGACSASVVIGAAIDLRHKEEPSVLTPREIAALNAYAECENMALAAEKLGVALSTAKNHLHSAYRKLDTTNSLGAMKALGWLEIPRWSDRGVER